jgi:hypothetical protein
MYPVCFLNNKFYLKASPHSLSPASCLSESANWRRSEFLQASVFDYFFLKKSKDKSNELGIEYGNHFYLKLLIETLKDY